MIEGQAVGRDGLMEVVRWDVVGWVFLVAGLFIFEGKRGDVVERTRFLGKRCRRSRLPILGRFHTAQNRRDSPPQQARIRHRPGGHCAPSWSYMLS